MNVQKLNSFCRKFGWPNPVRIPGLKLWSTGATITPPDAKVILEDHSIENNRNVRYMATQRYKRDIESNEFHTTHQGIGFNFELKLCDGKNRLTAIILSDTVLTIMATFGVNTEAMPQIDQVTKRSASDGARIAGLHLSCAEGSAIRNAVGMYGLTNAEILRAMNELHNSLGFVMQNLPANKKHVGIAKGPVRGAILKAHYCECDEARLAEFCECLREGVVRNDEDTAATCLYKYLLLNSNGAGWAFNASLDKKTQNAIRLFLNRTHTTILRSAKEPVFKLPTETMDIILKGKNS